MALPTGVSVARDLRIDFFRGLALVMIFVNHIPGNPLSILTHRAWGFSDSAETFVLLAGIASALAYSRFFDRDSAGAGVAAIASRIWSLYVTHLMLFLVVAALCVLGSERLGDASYLETLGFDVFLQAPAGFIVNVLTLTFLPGYLDILPLYVVLLALTPALFLLARRHWALPLLASLALYAAAQALPLNLPNTRTAREWFFNPFAWQLLFAIGFSIGRGLLIAPDRRFAVPPRIRTAITAFAILFSVTAFLIVAPWREWPGFENVFLVNPASLSTISKNDLHPVRLIDILTKFWLVVVFIDAGARWLRSDLARVVAQMGRHSLEVFAFSTILSVAGGIALTAYGFAPWLVAATNGLGIVAMALLGIYIEWRRRAISAHATRGASPPFAAGPAS